MNSVDETVYNLLNQIPQCPSILPDPSKHIYRSTFASDVVHNYNKHKYSHRTMGLAVIPKPDPCQPLRRRQNYIQLPEIKPFIRSHRMPPIPKPNKLQSKLSKDHVQENIIHIKNSLPKCSRRYIVSDRKGNKFLIDGSGLQKEFIYKRVNYGRIPSYLRAYKTCQQPPSCDSNENSMQLISSEEHFSLIESLKQRHQEVFTEYQRLPLRLESISSRKKHALLTEKLIQIERDLAFLDKHEHIFIDRLQS
ncbi:unnamed protein product [Adineta ricciae]|uniref:Enkurin domain-containing protein n=1 Tax=Adineta ricciae TaxID=249248 RepID=A0A814KQE7_ADIRI|nr:unnamed protein product [Adineta ricciae]